MKITRKQAYRFMIVLTVLIAVAVACVVLTLDHVAEITRVLK